MKHLLLLFAVSLFLRSSILAQPGWFLQESGTTSHLRSVSFTDSTTGTVAGWDGTILRTTDAGESWIQQNSGTSMRLNGVSFTDSDHGSVVGSYGFSYTILRTNNGGSTWFGQQASLPGWQLVGVWFVDENIGWIVGGPWTYGFIVKTTNGGLTWITQISGLLDPPYEISFINSNRGIAVGYDGLILTTTNGGVNWTSRISGTQKSLLGIGLADTVRAIAVGRDGTIVRTMDGGQSWTQLQSGTSVDLWSVSFSDSLCGTIVGHGGTILRTTDSGETWIPQQSGVSGLLNGVCFTDIYNGTAVGTDGKILRTVNGGVIPVNLIKFNATTSNGKVCLYWETATETNNLGFEIERKIIQEDAGYQWVTIGFREGYGTTTEVNEYSYIDNISNVNAKSLVYRLKQIDYNGTYEYSSEVFIDNPAPNKYILEQNYPNPFNPTTTINYKIPELSFVTLKVYDVLGNEIATLVNEEKPMGTYEITWYAENLPSGVYFYRLQAVPTGRQAGSFVETKKMVLLR